MSTGDSVRQYIDRHFDEFVNELRAAVQRPSIAAQNIGMAEAAQYFKDLLERHGISARIIPTKGHPVVYGDIRGESDKTVLFYDVQPPEYPASTTRSWLPRRQN